MAPAVSRRKLIQKLKKLGFEGPLSGGKHQFMKKGPLKLRIPNPHISKDIHESLLNEILRQAGITKKDWDQV